MTKRLRSLLLVPVLVLCAGCIFVPYFHDTSGPRSSISTRELEFITTGSTTIEDVLLRFGEPQEHYDAPTVFLYRWVWVKGFFFLVVGPGVAAVNSESTTEYTLHIVFDENNKVTRYNLSKVVLSWTK